MCAIIALLLVVFTGFLGIRIDGSLASAPESPVATVAAPQLVSCEAPPPEVDIAAALAYAGAVFDTPQWARTIGERELATTVTWLSTDYGAVAYLEYLHYNCGVTDEQINAYYSPVSFEILLRDYASYEQTAVCSDKSLRLHEFDAVTTAGHDVKIRYWAEPVSATRVAGLMLVFPANAPDLLDRYAGELFPWLPACEGK